MSSRIFVWVRFNTGLRFANPQSQRAKRASLALLLILLSLFSFASRAELAMPTPSNPCKLTSAQWLKKTAWPVHSLTLGDRSYIQAQILSILRNADSDVSVHLTRHFVAALLNYAAGAKPSKDLAAAQKWLIDNKTDTGLPYRISFTSRNGPLPTTLADSLKAYNSDGETCELAVGATDVDLRCEKSVTVPNPIGSPASDPFAIDRRVIIHYKDGFVSFLLGKMVLPGSPSDPILTRVDQFLNANKALFGLDSGTGDLKLIDIIDLDTERPPVPFSVDEKQRVRVMFERLIGGMPVEESKIMVFVDKTPIDRAPVIQRWRQKLSAPMP